MVLLSYTNDYSAETSKCFPQDSLVPTLANIFLDLESFIEIHTSLISGHSLNSRNWHQFDNTTPDGYRYEVEHVEVPPIIGSATRSMIQSSTPFIGSSMPQLKAIQNEQSQVQMMSTYQTTFKSYSLDPTYQGSAIVSQPEQFSKDEVIPEQPCMPFLPQEESFGQKTLLSSSIQPVTQTKSGQQNINLQFPQSHEPQNSIKQGHDDSVQAVSPHNINDLHMVRQRSPLANSIEMSRCFHNENRGDTQEYPDITTMINNNTSISAPLVETTFVDNRICSVCGTRITKDMKRHERTHQVNKRFSCKFPKGACKHRSGQFNRPYDFKKHLLNHHFLFDDTRIKKMQNLSDKLNHWGTCPCGQRFLSGDWLENHILTSHPSQQCPEWMMERNEKV